MRAIILSLTTALAALAFASAAEARHICRGKAHAHSAVFHVDLEYSDDGRPIGRHASWTPPGEGLGPPLLIINYELPGDTLGPPVAVSAVVIVPAGPQTRSNHANVVLQAPDGASLREPFMQFGQQIATLRGRGVTAAVTGLVTLADRKQNAAWLAKLEQGKFDLSVEGDRDERFQSRTFDLTDTAARDALFTQAYSEATQAAKTPLACEAVPN